MAFAGASDGFISDEWVAEVLRIVGGRDGDGGGVDGVDVSAGRATQRIPEAVMKENPEAYAPQIVSLGPYYHTALKDAQVSASHGGRSSVSQMEMLKLKSCTKDPARNDSNTIFHNFFESTVQPRKSELQEFYNWNLDAGFRKFGWMMTVDAFFLYQFLKEESCKDDRSVSRHDRSNEHRQDTINRRDYSARGSIKCDVVKLDNQLPLFLLDEVHRIKVNGNQSFDEFLRKPMASLCSFTGFDCSSVANLREEQHLLSYMYKCVSSFLEMEGEEKDPTGCQRVQTAIGDAISTAFRSCCFGKGKTGPRDLKVNATMLMKNGIIFTPSTLGKSEQRIKFNRYSGRVYLPELTVSDMLTEVVLRNLLALEFIEANRGTVITEYVELMKILIHTAEDVKVLRNCRIIVPGSSMISDDYIAAMWKDISKPFFAASIYPSSHFEEIKKSLHRNYYLLEGKAACLQTGIALLRAPFRIVKGVLLT